MSTTDESAHVHHYAGIQGAAREVAGQRRESAPRPGGHRFRFTDPAGNELAVWSDPQSGG